MVLSDSHTNQRHSRPLRTGVSRQLLFADCGAQADPDKNDQLHRQVGLDGPATRRPCGAEAIASAAGPALTIQIAAKHASALGP